MNVAKMLVDFLKAQGCESAVSEDIVYVVTPDDTVWDFTLPRETLYVNGKMLRREIIATACLDYDALRGRSLPDVRR